jgi:hypothetical protein
VIGEFKIVDRPITRLPEKLIKSLEKTRRDGSAISIDVTGMTERSAKRLAERLRRQGLAARVPYCVRSRLIMSEQENTLTLWAEEVRPIEMGRAIEMKRPELSDPVSSVEADDDGAADA